MEEKVAVLAAKVQTCLFEGKVPGSKFSSFMSLDFMLGSKCVSKHSDFASLPKNQQLISCGAISTLF